MLKRIFSKKSGFTLVEIIIAFAVFAIMSAMILQILNVVAFQRKSNTELSETIDEQEQYLIEHNKNPFDAGAAMDGTLSFDFGAGGKFDVSYQMNGATETGEVDGLAYFVSDKAVNTTPPDDDDDDDDNDDFNDNGGSQMDRFNTRLTGTRGFEYIKVAQVKKVREENYLGKTVYVYAFDLVANASANMLATDVPYANYRLYFYTKSGSVAPIAFANYLNDANPTADLGSIGSKSPIKSWTGATKSSPDTYNVYTASITSTNGIRIGSPFKGGGDFNSVSDGDFVCKICGTVFHKVNWGWKDNIAPWRQCPSDQSQQCGNNIASSTGVRFTDTNHTRIEVAFTVDPELTVDSFGANSENGVYKANANIGGNDTGPNIYGAFPK